MKKIALLLLLFTICNNKGAFSQTAEKVDSLGLPGDNLNLYAVLDLFQKSETFEAFEKSLNLEDSKINNLDLNNDEKTDYIKVIDHQTGESHAVVLQVIVNEKETQDVAVIEIEKDKAGKVIVQIVGNEELYGKDYIVEPAENDPTAKSADATAKPVTTPEKEKTVINNTTNNYYNNTPDTYVVVNQWPIVHYVYSPGYVVYVSPWYWQSYPIWWNPWSPWYWHSYYWHHYNHHHHHYHGYYHRTTQYRAPLAHGYYGPRRSVSATVQTHRAAKVYNKTYTSKSRTGDGKVGGGRANPAYDNKAGAKPTPVRKRDQGAVSKPSQKPNANTNNRPANKPSNTKPSSKPPRSGNVTKPSNKPSPRVNKPAPRQSAPKSGKKGGGGR